MKTYLPKESEIDRKWYVIDAEGQVLGRLAVQIANLIRGRNKAIYTPHLDTGDFVVVINCEKVLLTGKKETDKQYDAYSGHMGGRKVTTAGKLRQSNPQLLIENAVWGMIPKGKLGRAQFTKLRVYAGAEHPHAAQQPVALTV